VIPHRVNANHCRRPDDVGDGSYENQNAFPGGVRTGVLCEQRVEMPLDFRAMSLAKSVWEHPEREAVRA
jgi:hypothetical protein